MAWSAKLGFEFRGVLIMKLYQVFSIAGTIAGFLLIGVCISLSPWFNFYNNALSDLGNMALHGSTGWIFNVGLIAAGFFEALCAVLLSARRVVWKYLMWTIPLTVAGVDLALIGFFPENTGGTHFVVSVIFFVSLVLTMILYSYASWPLGTPIIGAASIIMGISSIIVWYVSWPWRGVAIQETVTSALAAFWLIIVCQKN